MIDRQGCRSPASEIVSRWSLVTPVSVSVYDMTFPRCSRCHVTFCWLYSVNTHAHTRCTRPEKSRCVEVNVGPWKVNPKFNEDKRRSQICATRSELKWDAEPFSLEKANLLSASGCDSVNTRFCIIKGLQLGLTEPSVLGRQALTSWSSGATRVT